MASLRSFFSIFLVIALAFALASDAAFPSIIQKFSRKNLMMPEEEACHGWMYSLEVNNYRNNYDNLDYMYTCDKIVADYVEGTNFIDDAEVAAVAAWTYAETVSLNSDGMDVFVLGVDDTLLSNLPYYRVNRYGWESFNETKYNEWVSEANAPPVKGGLDLYNELKKFGYKIILLTGRDEIARTYTEQNLRSAGFDNWDGLIMRGTEDQGKDAIVYKSEKRALLEKMGYRLHGNVGDQWSDLLGSSAATRSFKFPNPLYYVS